MANNNMNFMSGVHRLFTLSLDDSSVFNTMEGLKNYLVNHKLEDGSDSIPYNTQIVSVINGIKDGDIWYPRAFVIKYRNANYGKNTYDLYELLVNTQNVKNLTATLEDMKDSSSDEYYALKFFQDIETNGWVRSYNIETSELFARTVNVNNWEISQDSDNSLVFKYVPNKISDSSVTLILTDEAGNLLAADNNNAINARLGGETE